MEGKAIETSQSEFREAFESHREAVFRLLVRLARNPHDAEDLLQETYLTFWRKRSQYRGDGSLAGYLKKIAYRTFLNSRSRIAARRPPLPLAAAAEPADAESGDAVAERDAKTYLVDRVREALDTLPDGPREAFLLFRFEGLTCAEVAEVTDAPLKTVESRLKRATELLAARLRKHRDQLLPR